MFKKDYTFGLKKEVELLPTIRKFFNDETIIKLDDYNIFDFKGDNKYIELKSRNCNYNKYPTTMIGYNKIKKALELNEDIYFIFNFTDGIYYFKFDKNIQLEIKQGGRFDRGKKELSDYAFIPIEILKEII
jgi:hypothetical protein